MKTKTRLQMWLEPHQNVFIRPFQADLRGRRSILPAPGMHLTFIKNQNITVLLISITGLRNIYQRQLLQESLHAFTDQKKLMKSRKETVYYTGQRPSGHLFRCWNIGSSRWNKSDNQIEQWYLCNCKARQSQALSMFQDSYRFNPKCNPGWTVKRWD